MLAMCWKRSINETRNLHELIVAVVFGRMFSPLFADRQLERAWPRGATYNVGIEGPHEDAPRPEAEK